MRKIGIESGAYIRSWDTDFEAAFKKMRLHGFDCIDLNLADTCNTPINIYMKTPEEFERILKDVKAAADKEGIEIYQTHGPWRHPPKDATEEDRAEWRAYMERGMYGNYILGCKYFVIHPIMPFGTGAEPDSEMFYKLNYEFFKSLIPTAEKYGVVICVENMPFVAHSISRPVDIANFVKDLDSDYIAMCLDTGHAEVQKVKAADAVRAMKDKLVTLHVHDNDTYGDRHECPFFGATDWLSFRNALKECVDESVPVMLETTPGKAQTPAELRDMFLPCFAAAARWIANS